MIKDESGRLKQMWKTDRMTHRFCRSLCDPCHHSDPGSGLFRRHSGRCPVAAHLYNDQSRSGPVILQGWKRIRVAVSHVGTVVLDSSTVVKIQSLSLIKHRIPQINYKKILDVFIHIFILNSKLALQRLSLHYFSWIYCELRKIQYWYYA